VHVVDHLGEKVAATINSIDLNQYRIELNPDLPGGTYWVRAVFKNGQTVTRMVVKY